MKKTFHHAQWYVNDFESLRWHLIWSPIEWRAVIQEELLTVRRTKTIPFYNVSNYQLEPFARYYVCGSRNHWRGNFLACSILVCTQSKGNPTLPTSIWNYLVLDVTYAHPTSRKCVLRQSSFKFSSVPERDNFGEKMFPFLEEEMLKKITFVMEQKLLPPLLKRKAILKVRVQRKMTPGSENDLHFLRSKGLLKLA